jgi:outer membrane protein assembly factor BamB
MSQDLIVKKVKAIALATLSLFLILAAIFTAVPVASAHTPPLNINTYAFLNVAPNPVGINQPMFVNFWLNVVPPTSNGAYGERWQNFTVTITLPDATKKTLGPFQSDDVGGSYTTYTATKIGNYTFQFNFPGQISTAGKLNPSGAITNAQSIGDHYLPSTSDPYTVTVQPDSIPPFPSVSLPTDYWQRPIEATNTAWYTISGNWLGIGLTARSQSFYNAAGNYNPYTTAPNTAHILWAQSYAPGGLIGGEFGGTEQSSNFYSTAQYEPKFGPPIIMNGILYYNQVPGASTNQAGWVATNLRTGKIVWTVNTTLPLIMGQIYDYISPNQYGGLAYLWAQTGSTYSMYDAMTGKWILNIANVTYRGPTGAFGATMTFSEAPDGNLLGYFIDASNNTLNCFNVTRAIFRGPQGTGDLNNAWQWRPPQGANIPFAYGIEWSKPLAMTIVASNGTTVDINQAYAESSGVNNPLTVSSTHTNDVILVNNLPGPSTSFQQPGYIISEAYSATTGELLWGPKNQTQVPWSRLALTAINKDVYTIYTGSTHSYVAYSLKTGEQLWGPVQTTTTAWGYYTSNAIIAFGALYAADFGGYLNAFNVTTGALMWTWTPGSAGYETPYGVWPLLHIDAAADGKIYVLGGHQYSPPLYHGSKLYAIDAISGKLLWSIADFSTSNYANAAVSDGTLVMPNAYDNRIYAYDKGLSATTVSAPDTAIPMGTMVLVKGTVTDQSPGETALGIPAAGTPAISDGNMSAWMEYLYMQQPKPTNVQGVPVHVTAIDSNGNSHDIGIATSDVDGNFFISWTPPVPGIYRVSAAFEGSGAYYSSHAETGFLVSPAPSPSISATHVPTTETPAPTPVTSTPVASPSEAVGPGNPSNTALYVAVAAVVVILVIVAVAVVLRRRK